jgi:hypothetical protein
MLDYLEQGVNSLRLYVHHNTDPNLEQFNCIISKELVEQNATIRFGILAESHFVQITVGEETISEICACTDGQFVNQPQFASTLADLPHDTAIPLAGFHYIFSHGKMSITANRADFSSYEQVLKHDFPKQSPDEYDAYTEVGISVSPNTLRIQSVHTYPNEHAAVLTQSTITW